MGAWPQAHTMTGGIPGLASHQWRLTWRVGLAMFACAIGLRILVVAGALLVHGNTLEEMAVFRDGRSYIAMARALLGDRTALTAYDERVFVGFPALLAAIHLVPGIPLHVAGLVANWSCAGLASVLTALLFRDARAGWAMAILTPSYLMYSSLVMSESFYLALTLGSLLLALRSGNSLASGLLLGAAASVRPVALFPALAVGLVLWVRRRWQTAFILAASSALVVAGVLLFNRSWLGDALVSLNRYQDVGGFSGELFVLPFSALLSISFSGQLPLWKSAYLMAHLAFALAACGFAARESFVRRGSEDERLALLAFAWLFGNTIFAVSIGSVPGVNDFHRYIIPALPAAFYALREFLPYGPLTWTALGTGSLAFAIAASWH